MKSPTRFDRPQSGWLLTAILVTVVLWQLPYGLYLLYPFTILATWFHEMGHGLTALLLGGDFYRLVIEPNGSGYAQMRGPFLLGSFGEVLISANGPLGPALVGSGLVLASKSARITRVSLLALSIAIAISLAIWVRSMTGWVVLSLMAASIAWIVSAGKSWHHEMAIQFLGLQAFVSMFLQWDYLFTYSFQGRDGVQLSDTGQMQAGLGVPYWACAGVILLIAGWLMLASIRRVYGDGAYK